MRKDSLYKDEMAARMTFEKKPENRVMVSSILENPHPVVAATVKILSGQIKDKKREVCSTFSDEPVIGLHVSSALVDKALRISDALFKALEQRGIKITTLSEKGSPTNATFIVNGEEIHYHVEEIVRAHPFRPESEEDLERFRRGWLKHTYIRSGLLRLKAVSGTYTSAYEERRNKPLEEQINRFICTIYRRTYMALDYARMSQEHHIHIQKRDERLERYRYYLSRKERWREELMAMINARQEALQIRMILQEMEKAGIQKDPEWMAWARSYAEKIDPLIKK